VFHARSMNERNGSICSDSRTTSRGWRGDWEMIDAVSSVMTDGAEVDWRPRRPVPNGWNQGDLRFLDGVLPSAGCDACQVACRTPPASCCQGRRRTGCPLAPEALRHAPLQAQPPGFRPDPTFSLANSPVSPVDRLRLLTGGLSAASQGAKFQPSRERSAITSWS